MFKPMSHQIHNCIDNMRSSGPFSELKAKSPDPLLSLIGLYQRDPRPEKIDLGVGVYRDEAGATPVFAAVKAAEATILRDQSSKAYLGPEGNVEFLERLTPIVFGEGVSAKHFVAVQTPGGTGALRLAADLVAAADPSARVWMGTPSWPIHAGIFDAARLQVRTIGYFGEETRAVAFDLFMSELDGLRPNDVLLLHGACHNPTGADLSLDQWDAVADLLVRRGATPLVDLAYHGLGDGLSEDTAGLRRLMQRVETVMVAQSCDKSFGLYRERTGALFVRVPDPVRELVRSNVLQLARCAWSMPPDHGAEVARVILASDELRDTWQAELQAMRTRLNGLRGGLADAMASLEPLRNQRGLFALLPLANAQVQTLRREAGIYMADSGRINVAGLTFENLPRFVEALAQVY